MHILQTLEALVDDILFVNIFQDVGTDNSMQIRIHKVKDKVDVSIIFGSNRIL